MSGPFKLKGWSPFTQKDDHPKKETPPEDKNLVVTRGKTGDKKFDTAEDITDLEDRIEFLQSDIETAQAGPPFKGGVERIKTIKTARDKIKELRAAIAKLQPK